MANLSILIADDHPVLRAGMKALLAADPTLDVIGEASDGRVALRMVKELHPDVAVLDLSMPGLNGAAVTRQLQIDCPDCKVVVLTVHEDRAYVAELMEVGASGYVLKRSAPAELLRAIHAVAEGGVYLDPAIARFVVASARRREGGGGHADLTEREIAVLRLASLGHSNKSIAAQMGIGVKSVETYKARAMQKLGFQTRIEVVRYAIAQGWLTDD